MALEGNPFRFIALSLAEYPVRIIRGVVFYCVVFRRRQASSEGEHLRRPAVAERFHGVEKGRDAEQAGRPEKGHQDQGHGPAKSQGALGLGLIS